LKARASPVSAPEKSRNHCTTRPIKLISFCFISAHDKDGFGFSLDLAFGVDIASLLLRPLQEEIRVQLESFGKDLGLFGGELSLASHDLRANAHVAQQSAQISPTQTLIGKQVLEGFQRGDVGCVYRIMLVFVLLHQYRQRFQIILFQTPKRLATKQAGDLFGCCFVLGFRFNHAKQACFCNVSVTTPFFAIEHRYHPSIGLDRIQRGP